MSKQMPTPQELAREQREAASMRENLKRRKQQQQARDSKRKQVPDHTGEETTCP